MSVSAGIKVIIYAMKRWNIDRSYATFIYELRCEDKYVGQIYLKQPGLSNEMLTHTMQMISQYRKSNPSPLESG